MKKGVIIGIIITSLLLIIGIFAGGLWLLRDQSRDQPEVTVSLSGANHIVEIKNQRFMPSQLIVKVGEAVVWTNADSMSHTVISDSGNELSSTIIQPGDSYSHVFNKTGTFNYHCSIHSSMTGQIIVI